MEEAKREREKKKKAKVELFTLLVSSSERPEWCTGGEDAAWLGLLSKPRTPAAARDGGRMKGKKAEGAGGAGDEGHSVDKAVLFLIYVLL